MNNINFCEAFAEKVADKMGFENKVRYLLEDFFFKEGWASRTNPEVQKEGYSAQLKYNGSTIKHFIEDFVRWSQLELKELQEKNLKDLQRGIEENEPSEKKV